MTPEQEVLAVQLGLTPADRDAITLWWLRQSLGRRQRLQFNYSHRLKPKVKRWCAWCRGYFLLTPGELAAREMNGRMACSKSCARHIDHREDKRRCGIEAADGPPAYLASLTHP